MQTSNPAFNQNLLSHFDHASSRSTTMTVAGTSIKTLILLALVMLSAGWAWTEAADHRIGQGVLAGSAIVGSILALIQIFKPTTAAWLSPVYAVAEGVFLGMISRQFDAYFPGIAIQAVALTGATTFVMLTLFSTRIIRVTERLTTAIVAATGAICLVYFVSFLLRLFGMNMPYIHSAGPIGIGFSLVVVGIAAFNLLLDFDFIEKGSMAGLPKNMEWYGAFGLMVTLIWLYIQILQLLAKLQSRSSDD